MSTRYQQVTNRGSETHFASALSGAPEFSRMTALPTHITTLNAGDIVPVYCAEVLPNETISLGINDAVIRETTLRAPVMGNLVVDFYAFFVPNRVVNDSFKAVMGENYSGSWTATAVSLAPLVGVSQTGTITVPVGSVADYYGFPTQSGIPVQTLQACHDLKFRGYVEIYNTRFRDQNYQPPIAMSHLNVFQNFFGWSGSDTQGYRFNIDGSSSGNVTVSISPSVVPDGSYGKGAVQHALVGSGTGGSSSTVSLPNSAIAQQTVLNHFSALNPPLKANKLHDYFTSVLPSPQKGASVFAPITITSSTGYIYALPRNVYSSELGSDAVSGVYTSTTGQVASTVGVNPSTGAVAFKSIDSTALDVYFNNLGIDVADLRDLGSSLSVDDLRQAVAVQQVYEALARSGSRYREYVRGFFGLEVDDPFLDIPQYLGHIRRDLAMYQTAQTSASVEDSTPQGNLAAFGYTTFDGHLFNETFKEHGYIHVMAVIRQKNIYPSYLARDNFRMSFLDFYQPQLANISEQPVYRCQINPFVTAAEAFEPFGYQEAWAEYRFEPDYVTGYMRPGLTESLSLWNYADNLDTALQIADSSFMKSNAQEVVDRSLALTSSTVPQFKAQITFAVDKQLPMPTYSIPGLDVL
uniref:Major capsid protein n=1 Tax=Dulem virus 209 TaxID=3145686 RepID=A0AAU8B4P3_9VIRU